MLVGLRHQQGQRRQHQGTSKASEGDEAAAPAKGVGQATWEVEADIEAVSALIFVRGAVYCSSWILAAVCLEPLAFICTMGLASTRGSIANLPALGLANPPVKLICESCCMCAWPGTANVLLVHGWQPAAATQPAGCMPC